MDANKLERRVAPDVHASVECKECWTCEIMLSLTGCATGSMVENGRVKLLLSSFFFHGNGIKMV